MGFTGSFALFTTKQRRPSRAGMLRIDITARSNSDNHGDPVSTSAAPSSGTDWDFN